MSDTFQSFSSGLDSPAGAGSAITPSDGTDLTVATRAIYVGTGGNLRVIMISGEDVTLTNVVAGMIYPLRVRRVMATGTTAAALAGLR